MVIDLWRGIRKIIEFPQPVVCKHWAALVLLEVLNNQGVELPEDLVKAIVDADDETSLSLLEDLI
jgi:hypothetical protein